MPQPRSRTRHRAQTSIYETTREDPELEKALETRESMLAKLSEAKHNAKVADDAAQALITKIELGDDAAVRVGRFVITVKRMKGRTVQSFDVAPATRIKITSLEDVA